MSLFRLDASILPGTSTSAELADLLEAEWSAARPDEPVVRRHPGTDPPAVPLYNFGVPQHVKTRNGLMHAAAGAVADGLPKGKPTVLVTVRGGGYGPGTPRPGWDHSPYLRRILGDHWQADLTVIERGRPRRPTPHRGSGRRPPHRPHPGRHTTDAAGLSHRTGKEAPMNASKSFTPSDSAPPRKQKTSLKGVPDPSLTMRPIPVEELDLASKKLAVIGGTNGLGRAIAQQALARGADVTVVGRTFRDEPADRLTFVAADLSSMSEAVRLGRELPAESFDVVLFTTGIIAAKTREETREHVERDMAISYLSRLAVLQGLSPRLGSAREDGAPRPRVFVMGSPGVGQTGDPDDLNSEKDYRPMVAHGSTVAGNEILVLGAKDRFPGPAFFGLGPYLIKTGIRSNFLGDGSITHKLVETAVGVFMQSPETYAKRMVPLLFAPELEGRTGLMFGHKAQPILPTQSLDQAYVDRYLSASEDLLRRALATATTDNDTRRTT